MTAEAILFGLIASAALVIGGVCGSMFRLPQHLVAAALAFAAGALLSAFAFELVERPYDQSGGWIVGLSLVAGAVVFIAADEWIEIYERGSVGLAITAGVILDGVPENLALGAATSEAGGAMALLVAIVASNLPESFAGAIGMREEGRSRRFAIGTWSVAAFLLLLAVIGGEALAARLGDDPTSALQAFAGGAVLATLAATVFPDAYRRGGPLVALATVAGFLLTFLLVE